MLAIISARGGSKGVPGKNNRLLYCKSLVQLTIESAIHAVKIDKISLSTDDEKSNSILR